MIIVISTLVLDAGRMTCSGDGVLFFFHVIITVSSAIVYSTVAPFYLKIWPYLFTF